MDESTGSKRAEAREFWEAAIRLWTDSGLSVQEFCGREGLAEHAFYSWRRELLRGSPPPTTGRDTAAENCHNGYCRALSVGRILADQTTFGYPFGQWAAPFDWSAASTYHSMANPFSSVGGIEAV